MIKRKLMNSQAGVYLKFIDSIVVTAKIKLSEQEIEEFSKFTVDLNNACFLVFGTVSKYIHSGDEKHWYSFFGNNIRKFRHTMYVYNNDMFYDTLEINEVRENLIRNLNIKRI